MILNSTMQNGGSYTGILIVIFLLLVVGVIAMLIPKRVSARASEQARIMIDNINKEKETDEKDNFPPGNHLAWAILTTVFCCLPVGIIAIVKAASVNSAWIAGRKEEAIKNSMAAKMWCQIGTFVPLGLFAIYLVVYLIGIALFAH